MFVADYRADNRNSSASQSVTIDDSVTDANMTSLQASGALDSARFLSSDEVLTVLSLLASGIPGLGMIPGGAKENKYFIVKNASNVEQRTSGKRSSFVDDCGVWISNKTGTPPTYFIVNEDSSATFIERKLGVYGRIVKRQFVPLSPQPDQKDIVVLRRSYSTLKRCCDYRRRVSWVESTHAKWSHALAVVEYIGLFPDAGSPHGNSRASGSDYVRTDPTVTTAIDAELQNRKRPRDVYQDLTSQQPDSGPRNMRQVYNRKQNLQAKQGTQPCGNVADEVQTVLSMLQTSSIVKVCVAEGDKPPCVIVYDDRQLADVKRFCCGKSPTCVLGVDRTFNVGKCFVTVTTYKYTDVIRLRSSQPPIFLGPLYLHWDATLSTYANFFQHLRLKLACEVDTGIVTPADVKVGSDDERAMRNALSLAFPSGCHLLCIQHLRQNVQHYLRNKVGASSEVRRQVEGAIFGDLAVCKSEDDFDTRASALTETFRCEIVFTARRYASVVLAVVVCLCVLSLIHI